MHIEVAKGRFPELIETVDPSVDRWHESGVSESRHSGFPRARDLESRIRDPRTPEVDVAAWGPRV
jgi:predicted Rdx family selenoprotein